LDYKSIFENVKDQNTFIKTTVKPNLDGANKVALNRKGNMLFNSGDIEGARRIFLTTGYSDGLVRIGDHYNSQGRSLDALRMYWIAPDKSKADAIISRLSELIQGVLGKEGSKADDG
jgi:hypothetical protein